MILITKLPITYLQSDILWQIRMKKNLQKLNQ